MKLIIDVDEDNYKAICSDKGYSYANTMWWIIRNGTPYNPTGDLISRYDAVIALNEAQIEGTPEYRGLGKAKQIIDDLQAVEPKTVCVGKITLDEDKLKEIVHTEVADKIEVDCQNCGYYEFTRKFASGIVEIMSKYGITSIEELKGDAK